ncbi:MAG: HEPN domain-containing protein [Deltaproteobacteria bacterium]|nr:HEPN domain-containing protein [Deltaproteobacteria bacterium]
MKADASDLWTRAVQALRTTQLMLSLDPDAAASRAYYAAFYAVSALFALRGKTFSKHAAVRAAVHRDLVKAGDWLKERGEDYSLLFKLRDIGDYGGGIHVSDEEASEALEAARRILQAVHDAGPQDFSKPDDSPL